MERPGSAPLVSLISVLASACIVFLIVMGVMHLGYGQNVNDDFGALIVVAAIATPVLLGARTMARDGIL